MTTQVAASGSTTNWRLAICIVAALALAACHKESDLQLPDSISQAVSEGGPNPANVAVSFTNTGSCALSYSASVNTADGLPWLSISGAASGSVAAAATGSVTLAFDVVSTALKPGTHTGSFILIGTCATNGHPARGSPAVVPVNLTVRPVSAGISLGTPVVSQDVVTLANTWSAVAPGFTPRYAPGAGVWTGNAMLVWGGTDFTNIFGDGASYDPLANLWSSISALGAPVGRADHTVTWAADRMVVWGGNSGVNGAGSNFNTGGVYTPSSDSWTKTSTTGAPSARSRHTAVWTGTRVIVWGGATAAGSTNDGGQYSPSGDSWSAVTTAGAPSARADHLAVWTGTRMFVWGGSGLPFVSPETGGLYDPALDAWTPVATAGAPSSRTFATAVWTGSRVLVWGGTWNPGASQPPYNDGAAYDPARNTWTPISTNLAPSARYSHLAAWTGNRMVIWGGTSGTMYPTDGGIYDPVTDSWTVLSTTGAPQARARPPNAWTGASLIIWGGANFGATTSGALGDGAIFQ